METNVEMRHTHEVVALHHLLSPCWKGVVVLQDLSIRFSHPGWKDVFVRSWHQLSDSLTDLESKIWELGGETDPKTYASHEQAADPEDEPQDPLSLNRILLLRSINHLTHLMHLYGEVRRIPLSFDVRMVLQRHQLGIRESLEQLSSLYVNYPAHRTVRNPTLV